MSKRQFKAAAVQAAPAFLDLAGSVEKTIAFIDEAGAKGVDLIAFPETWIPGYPWHIWLGAPAWGMQFVGRYFQNSIAAGSAEEDAIHDAVRRNNLTCVLGVSDSEKLRQRDHGCKSDCADATKSHAVRLADKTKTSNAKNREAETWLFQPRLCNSVSPGVP